MSGNGLVEWFTVRKSAEVERLAPAIFVQIRSKVIVAGILLDYNSSTDCLIPYCLVKVAYSAFRAWLKWHWSVELFRLDLLGNAPLDLQLSHLWLLYYPNA